MKKGFLSCFQRFLSRTDVILGRPFADVDHDFQTDLRKQGNQGIDRKGFDLAPHEHGYAGLVNAQAKGSLFLRQPLCLDIVNQARDCLALAFLVTCRGMFATLALQW